jgi:ankyrin repeat protein
MNNDNKLKKAIRFNELGMVRYFVEEKGIKISYDAVGIAGKNRHLDMVKYLVEKGAEINYGAVSDALIDKNLAIVKYLVEKGATINDNAVQSAAYSGDLDLVTYLVGKGATINDNAVQNAINSGDLDLVTYLVKNGGKIIDDITTKGSVLKSNKLDIVKYLLSILPNYDTNALFLNAAKLAAGILPQAGSKAP